MTAFDRALAFTLGQEGEWADDPRDAGGRTRWGISSRAHPEVDLDTLTREGAATVYKASYWDMLRASELPESLAVLVFDVAVQSGVEAAAKALQRAVRAFPDGRIGLKTLTAVHSADPARLLRTLLQDRARQLVHIAAQGANSAFLAGWMARLVDLALEVSRPASGPPPTP